MDKNNIIEFALEFLRSNLEDPEVAAMLAEKLGICESEEEFDEKGIDPLIEEVSKVLADYC